MAQNPNLLRTLLGLSFTLIFMLSYAVYGATVSPSYYLYQTEATVTVHDEIEPVRIYQDDENTTTWTSPVHAPNRSGTLDANVSSTLPGSTNGSWTVVLHDPSPLRPLVAALQVPDTSEPEITEPLSGGEITLLTAALVVLCAPATVMLWRSMTSNQPVHSDEEA